MKTEKKSKFICSWSHWYTNLGNLCVGHVSSDTVIHLKLGIEDLWTFMSNFGGCQDVKWLFISNLCRVSSESIQFVYNIQKRKGEKGYSESLWELTAGAEKNDEKQIIYFLALVQCWNTVSKQELLLPILRNVGPPGEFTQANKFSQRLANKFSLVRNRSFQYWCRK